MYTFRHKTATSFVAFVSPKFTFGCSGEHTVHFKQAIFTYSLLPDTGGTLSVWSTLNKETTEKKSAARGYVFLFSPCMWLPSTCKVFTDESLKQIQRDRGVFRERYVRRIT